MEISFCKRENGEYKSVTNIHPVWANLRNYNDFSQRKYARIVNNMLNRLSLTTLLGIKEILDKIIQPIGPVQYSDPIENIFWILDHLIYLSYGPINTLALLLTIYYNQLSMKCIYKRLSIKAQEQKRVHQIGFVFHSTIRPGSYEIIVPYVEYEKQDVKKIDSNIRLDRYGLIKSEQFCEPLQYIQLDYTEYIKHNWNTYINTHISKQKSILKEKEKKHIPPLTKKHNHGRISYERSETTD